MNITVDASNSTISFEITYEFTTKYVASFTNDVIIELFLTMLVLNASQNVLDAVTINIY